MKKIIMIALAFSAVTFSASAQEKREMKDGGRHHSGMRKHHNKGMMAKQLNFSEDQKKQAKLINVDFKQKMKTLNSNESITVKEQRDRKHSLMQERKAKMDGLLTPEQKTKLAQLKEDRKKKSEEHFAKRLDKMKTNLGLSETQVGQLKTQREAMHAKMKAIKDNQGLSREQKKEQFMALKADAKEQHKKIFTADQMKKMEEMKKKHFDKSAVK
jgi:protein CpxP